MNFTGFSIWTVAALIAVSAGILWLLQRLCVQPKPLQVPTLLFWSQVISPVQAKTLFERFRHPITYLLLLLMFALLSLALGRPEWTQESKGGTTTVVILDDGMSMAGPMDDQGNTRLDRAKEEILRIVKQLSRRDRIAVIVADSSPRLIQQYNDPMEYLPRRLAKIHAGLLPSDLPRAIHLGSSLLQGTTHSRLILITDQAVKNQTGLQVIRIGNPLANAAILSAIYDEQNRLHVRAGYWGKEKKEVTLSIHHGNDTKAYEQNISPGSTAEFVISDYQADGSELAMNLLTDDPVKIDNVLSYRLPLHRRVRIYSHVNLPAVLLTAIKSNPSLELVESDEKKEADIMVYDDIHKKNMDRPAIILVNSGKPGEQDELVETIFTDLNFEGAKLRDVLAVENLSGTIKPLLWAGQSILAGITSEGSKRILYLSSSLFNEKMSINHHSAFAIFLARAIGLLLDKTDDPVTLSARRMQNDPLWPARFNDHGLINQVVGDRVVSNFMTENTRAKSTAKSTDGYHDIWQMLSNYELLLLAGLFLFIFEGILHARGRIS